jgi:hypothetical protein
MAKSVRDTLTMDAAPIETEFKRARDLGLDGFYAVDGASVRLCTERATRATTRSSPCRSSRATSGPPTPTTI